MPGSIRGAASAESARRANLSVVLRLLHRHGTTSRARLTELAGYSRSTMGVLLEELARLDLVEEGQPQAQRLSGRPSLTLAPTDVWLAASVNVDVGGVEVALTGIGGRVVAIDHVTTHQPVTPYEAAHLAGELMRGLRTAQRAPTRIVQLVAVIPGRVQTDTGVVIQAPHLGWHNVPFAQLLGQVVGLPVTLAHDGHVGALAEALRGDVQDLAYLYGGPGGIGAGIIAGGRLYLGPAHLAGRLAHLYVSDDGPECYCGGRGCLTSVLSHRALTHLLGVSADAGNELREAILSGGARISAALDILLRALRTIVACYDPDLIVLGGSLSPLLTVGRQQLEAGLLQTNLKSARQVVRLAKPALGSDQFHIGACDLALAPLLEDPAGFCTLPA
ncbi:ROK family protein [Streptosporangium sp. G11]|uniref:ROK family protein n=1 Tax=Streptosporangium sp. G11 TaxID=3436926 RepID=UPI003EC07F49